MVIPCLNEAGRLPLLLSDLQRWKKSIEVIVIDGGSSDKTISVAKLAGAKVITYKKGNRGAQLRSGGEVAKGEWILFIHADSRLSKDWAKKLTQIISDPKNSLFAWFFNLKIEGKGFRILEIAVNLRSNLLKKPYGDQGVFIRRSLYNKIGGYAPLHLMEDLEFGQRLSTITTFQNLNINIYTNSRRWKNRSVIKQALINAKLRHRWKRGENTQDLLEDYYQQF